MCLYTVQFVQLTSTVETATSDVVHIVTSPVLQAQHDVSVTGRVSRAARRDGPTTTVPLVCVYYTVLD